ncbi:unnamed protein product [Protopolystoma xenopodis]|uniref:Uncharacterized protein n=1 Tax=Protopolystoma xenopodis TaxID=117903 RepID=A0A3S5BWV2_9PLAT|nr:unnamed protein product [Protopolystoma xenopodis]
MACFSSYFIQPTFVPSSLSPAEQRLNAFLSQNAPHDPDLSPESKLFKGLLNYIGSSPAVFNSNNILSTTSATFAGNNCSSSILTFSTTESTTSNQTVIGDTTSTEHGVHPLLLPTNVSVNSSTLVPTATPITNSDINIPSVSHSHSELRTTAGPALPPRRAPTHLPPPYSYGSLGRSGASSAHIYHQHQQHHCLQCHHYMQHLQQHQIHQPSLSSLPQHQHNSHSHPTNVPQPNQFSCGQPTTAQHQRQWQPTYLQSVPQSLQQPQQPQQRPFSQSSHLPHFACGKYSCK